MPWRNGFIIIHMKDIRDDSGGRTPYEVRSEALKAETPAEYKIPENKRIMKYKQEHYKSQQAEI